VPNGELRQDAGFGGGHLPAGAAHVFGVVAGVEAEAGGDHEDVLGVGVDGDPLAGARVAVVGELAAHLGVAEEVGAVEGVGDRA
jgi:hypothetical protein